MPSARPSSSRAERARRALPALAGASTIACALAALAVATTPACLTRACDRSDAVFWEFRKLDDDTWESSPVDGKWLPYPHQRTWAMYYASLSKGRTPTSVDVFISADESPNRRGSNFTIGGGDVVKLHDVTYDHLFLENGTCADYFVRVVVHAPRSPLTLVAVGPEAADADAGVVDARDASALDATSDSPD